MPSAKALEGLPFLNAVFKESIRLRVNAPTSNPRLTHSGITSLGLYGNIPVGTRVNALPGVCTEIRVSTQMLRNGFRNDG